ncbi:hypothetical protein PoB_004732800 [Plakobranchus ocellatus]|uniref:Secreted protein n=1 Tax=Plakobranchus ocellatus TaxID=259542 RepID=A0AAV4BNX3_9GAST|nr:hypothetical protein PoB_004732800 [Plakobranchus ocellatus]
MVFFYFCFCADMRNGGSSGRAGGYHTRNPRFVSQSGLRQFFIALLCLRSTNRVAKTLNPRESKGGEESNGTTQPQKPCDGMPRTVRT